MPNGAPPRPEQAEIGQSVRTACILPGIPSVTRKRKAESARQSAADRLIAATERLLASGTPYIELSVEQLCSEAGVARSTFYVHFRDKGELVTKLSERMINQLAEAAAAWWSSGETSRAEVLVATRRLVDVTAEHRQVMLALSETAAYDPEIRAIQESMLDGQAAPLAELIDAGKRAGTVRDIHTRETVVAIVGMVQVACERLGGGDEEELQRLAEAITSIAWHALYFDDAEDG